MKNRFLKRVVMAACAFGMLAAVSVNSSLAYFTTYAMAEGTVDIDLKYSYTKPHEEKVVEMKKRVTLENTGVADVWVRIKVFAPADVDLRFSDDKGMWTPGATKDANGFTYYYYSEILKPGETTKDVLNVEIRGIDPNETSNKFNLKPEDFNVIVVEECCPVLYEGDGTPTTPTEQYWEDSKVEKVQ